MKCEALNLIIQAFASMTTVGRRQSKIVLENNPATSRTETAQTFGLRTEADINAQVCKLLHHEVLG